MWEKLHCGGRVSRFPSQKPRPKWRVLARPRSRTMGQSYQHCTIKVTGREAGKEDTGIGTWVFPTLVLDVKQVQFCLTVTPVSLGLSYWVSRCTRISCYFPACFTYKVFSQHRNFFPFLLGLLFHVPICQYLPVLKTFSLGLCTAVPNNCSTLVCNFFFQYWACNPC